MNSPTNFEVEMTSVWSFIHATVSGCMPIAIWESIKFIGISQSATWIVFFGVSLTGVHAIQRHRKALRKMMSHPAMSGPLHEES